MDVYSVRIYKITTKQENFTNGKAEYFCKSAKNKIYQWEGWIGSVKNSYPEVEKSRLLICIGFWSCNFSTSLLTTAFTFKIQFLSEKR